MTITEINTKLENKGPGARWLETCDKETIEYFTKASETEDYCIAIAFPRMWLSTQSITMNGVERLLEDLEVWAKTTDIEVPQAPSFPTVGNGMVYKKFYFEIPTDVKGSQVKLHFYDYKNRDYFNMTQEELHEYLEFVTDAVTFCNFK